jgi:hypothetical protein
MEEVKQMEGNKKMDQNPSVVIQYNVEDGFNCFIFLHEK